MSPPGLLPEKSNHRENARIRRKSECRSGSGQGEPTKKRIDLTAETAGSHQHQSLGVLRDW